MGHFRATIFIHHSTQVGALNKVVDTFSRKTSLLTTMKSKVIGFELLKDSLSIDPFFGPIMEDVSIGAQGGFALHKRVPIQRHSIMHS
jgi:hypothetical protein